MTAPTSPAPGGSFKKFSRWKRSSASRSSGKLLSRAATRRLLLALAVAAGTAAGILPQAARAPSASSPAPFPHAARAARVIDGDTIQLDGGALVRYIGIDTPESRRRRGDRWISDPEPYAREATEANRRLVEGRALR